MSSGTEIIQEALQKIGAHSVTSPAQPESIEVGRNKLNSLIQMWLSKSIDMGCMPLKAPGDELNEPLDARECIISVLALNMAPEFNREPSSVVRAQAALGMQTIKQLYQNLVIPNKKVSSTMPRGAGSTRGPWGNPFAKADREIEN